MNYGYQNEIDFVNHFNDKFFDEFDQNTKCFLVDLFGNVFDNTEKIKSWKNKMVQKADIFIKYKNYTKRSNEFTSPHIACLTIGPKKRILNGDSLNQKDRYLVCIRWNFIRESIIDFKKSKEDESSIYLL